MNNVTQSRRAEKNPDGKEKTVRRLCAVVIDRPTDSKPTSAGLPCQNAEMLHVAHR